MYTTTTSIICIIIIVLIIDQSSLSSITRTTSNTVDAFQNYAHHRRIVQCHYATLDTALESPSPSLSPCLPKIRLQQQVELIIPTTQLEENDDVTILGRSSSSSTSTSTRLNNINNINKKKSSTTSSSNVNSHNIASIWANSLETNIPLHAGSRLWLEKNRRN